MQDILERQLSQVPRGWTVRRLQDLPTVRLVGYGITSPGEPCADGIGMIRAADIKDGRLHSPNPKRISPQTHNANLRSRLQAWDVVVVLVGRVGEAAVVGAEFHDWNCSRTVGIIRGADPDEAAWLSLWLRSPEVRQWCEMRSVGSTLHRTLSLAVLRELPVPMPPRGPRAAFLRAVRLLDAKSATNARIAACATEVSDAQFTAENRERGSWPERPFGALVELSSGATSRPQSGRAGKPGEDGTPFVAPADILQADLPYLRRTERSLALGEEGSVWGPDCLLVAAKEGGARAVMNKWPIAVGRGVLVLRPESAADAHWLLHEIRSRSAELAAAAGGSAGREVSRRAFGTTPVRWPPREVRERFAQLAERLHTRAQTAHAENETLPVLRDRLLDGFVTGTFARPSA